MNTAAPPPDVLMDRLSRRERALVQKQGVRAVEQLRNEWNGQRTWLYGLSGVMALLAVALPTGLVHQYLTTAGVLSSLDILGVVAAGAAFAALHGAGAVYFWTHWNQRARTLDLLHTWLHPAPAPSEQAA
ncbi:MAG: hypothetical protein R6U20_04075 [Longimonas sp.]|uniref:hypothetical protein n=1 Tax=Longimonas sp. TaxID=2039626 RepID=UPI0039748521